MSIRVFFRIVAVVAVIFAAHQALAQGDAYEISDPTSTAILLSNPGVRVVVLYFAATDCPISNREVPEVVRLTRQFPAPSVRFWWVYPNAEDNGQTVVKHLHDFSIPAIGVVDHRQVFVALAHATITPEVAVFLVEGKKLHEVYHGRIDNRYITLGQERPQANHHDLELAIGAALAGKPVPQPDGPPVGCAIAPPQK
jgi:hypothetical protein